MHKILFYCRSVSLFQIGRTMSVGQGRGTLETNNSSYISSNLIRTATHKGNGNLAVGALVRSSVSESYKNCRPQPPPILMSESCGRRMSLIWLAIQQVLLLIHTDPFSTVKDCIYTVCFKLRLKVPPWFGFSNRRYKVTMESLSKWFATPEPHFFQSKVVYILMNLHHEKSCHIT